MYSVINDHSIAIEGLGSLGNLAAETLPTVAIYRRTAGAGSYYLIANVDIKNYTYIKNGYNGGHVRWAHFADYGASNLTGTWIDPATEIKVIIHQQ